MRTDEWYGNRMEQLLTGGLGEQAQELYTSIAMEGNVNLDDQTMYAFLGLYPDWVMRFWTLVRGKIDMPTAIQRVKRYQISPRERMMDRVVAAEFFSLPANPDPDSILWSVACAEPERLGLPVAFFSFLSDARDRNEAVIFWPPTCVPTAWMLSFFQQKLS